VHKPRFQDLLKEVMMAGKGFAPKDSKGVKTVAYTPSAQPPLPDFMPDGSPWPDETITFWAALREYPLSVDWTLIEWLYHMDTAVMHGEFWLTGKATFASELRLRLAKIGATAEDRARLRIAFANADEAESKGSGDKPPSARDTFSGLRTVK
jgi:hypothetical protein